MTDMCTANWVHRVFQHLGLRRALLCRPKGHYVLHQIWCCCAGLCFLLAFFSWGGLCVTQLGTVAGRASSLALWGAVTGLAAVLLVVQVCLW